MSKYCAKIFNNILLKKKGRVEPLPIVAQRLVVFLNVEEEQALTA